MTEPLPPTNDALLLVKMHLRQGAEEEFTAWRARALTSAAVTEGFLSSEVTPAAAHSSAWTVTLRFRDPAHLEAWRHSPAWQSLIGDTKTLLADQSVLETEVKQTGPDGGVVEVIITRVKPGQEEAYRAWETRIQQAQSKFPGYLGSYVQPPIAGELGWMTLMRFASAEHLDQWLKSRERAALLEEANALIDYAHLQRMDTSFPGWFPTDPATGQGPPNWKAAMLVLLGLFPIVMLESHFLSPHLAGLNLSPAMFIGNVISVALTTWLTMPLFIKAFGWWLFPKDKESQLRTDLAGTALIALLFAIEIALLTYL